MRPWTTHAGLPSLLLPLLVFCVLTGCAPARLQTKNGIYHSVKKGETLWRICYTYKANMQTVCRINGIKDPENILVGQRLFIPGARRVLQVKLPGERAPGGKAAEKKAAPRFMWPVRGQVSSWFGLRKGERHNGIDIVAPKGTRVRAAAAGRVVYSADGVKGYGNLVIIQHTGKFTTVYAHNRKNLVSVDDSVGKGQVIAEVGNTGRSSGPHLHFEIRKGVGPVDPVQYLP